MISDLVFTLEKEIPHPAPEADTALVSQMKANIEFSGGAESSAKLPVPAAGCASSRRYLRRPLQRFVGLKPLFYQLLPFQFQDSFMNKAISMQSKYCPSSFASLRFLPSTTNPIFS